MTLRTRPLGNSGIQVSEIGLGTWQFGNPEWNGPDADESTRIVDEALRAGCTFIDTASGYADGRSEEFLGQALQGRREQAVLCTKVWADEWTLDPRTEADRIERSVEDSLRRLRTDYLDILLVHSPPAEILDGRKAPQFAVLQRLVDSGVLRAYGVSGQQDTSAEIRTIVETTGSQAIEMRYNALYQEPAGAFEQAAAAGVGLIIKVPLESGWLSGKYDASSTFDGPRGRWSAEEIERRANLVEEFRSTLPAGVSLTHAALSHILARPEVSTVIPGTRSVEQLRDSLAAADVRLPAETLAAIDELGTGSAREPLPW